MLASSSVLLVCGETRVHKKVFSGIGKKSLGAHLPGHSGRVESDAK